jgi:hypothetical protein
MGFDVNASSKHLLNWHDMYVEVLPPAEATTARKEFHISSRAEADASNALKVFNTEGPEDHLKEIKAQQVYNYIDI